MTAIPIGPFFFYPEPPEDFTGYWSTITYRWTESQDDGLSCCGGNDQRPPHHCSDCPVHPWKDVPPEVIPFYKAGDS